MTVRGLFLMVFLLFAGCAVNPVLTENMIISESELHLKLLGKSLQIGRVQMVEAFKDSHYPVWDFETDFIPPLRKSLTQTMKNSGLFEEIMTSGNAEYILDVLVNFRTGSSYAFRGGVPAIKSEISNYFTFHYLLKNRFDNRIEFECVIEKGRPVDKKVPLTSRLARNSEIIVRISVKEFLQKLADHLERYI